MCKDRLLRPSQIIAVYPEIAKHFNSAQLGYLLNLGLIKGKKTSRSSVLSVNSIKKIIKFKEKHVLSIPE